MFSSKEGRLVLLFGKTKEYCIVVFIAFKFIIFLTLSHCLSSFFTNKEKFRDDLSLLFSKRLCEKYYAGIYLNYFLKFPDSKVEFQFFSI